MEVKVKIGIPRPHEKQMPFVKDKKKRKIGRTGRRGGKTHGATQIAVKAFKEGRRILYAAPTTEQLDRFWGLSKRILAPAIDVGAYYKNETKHIIERPGTENRIRAKTAWNADTLRGDYTDLLILDEWQLMDEEAWELVGVPMLLDNNGDAVFLYTPPSIRSRSVSKARDPKHASKMFKRAENDTTGRWGAYHWPSHDNPHISEEALKDITLDMTNLAYRQEILAEDIDEVPGALWTRELIEKMRVDEAPELQRIVIPVDPQGTVKEYSETGIVPCGLGVDGNGYILSDYSLNARPETWGRSVVSAYEHYQADRVVAETNYGGDMVASVIRSVDPTVPVKMVPATRGKIVRAEPISAYSEQGKIFIVGVLPYLEDEMCTYTRETKISPNRLDSLVWGMTELMGRKRQSFKTAARLGELRDLS